jgi:thiol-disulfide isomerase/thioredoxin
VATPAPAIASSPAAPTAPAASDEAPVAAKPPKKARKAPPEAASSAGPASMPAGAPPAAEASSSPPPGASRATGWRAPAVEPARPTEGCWTVEADGLRAALVPNGKPLVVNHWATWCDPCADELPRLVRAAAGVADLGEFVGVSWDLFDHPGRPSAIARKVAQIADGAGVGYGNVLFTGKPAELFEICGLDVELVPQTLVIATDGRVVWHKAGVIEHDDVFPLINAVKAARA